MKLVNRRLFAIALLGCHAFAVGMALPDLHHQDPAWIYIVIGCIFFCIRHADVAFDAAA